VARLRTPVSSSTRRSLIALVILVWLGVACSARPIPDAAPTAFTTVPEGSGGVPTPQSASSPGVGIGRTASTPSRADPDTGGALNTTTAPSPMRQGTVAQHPRIRFLPEKIDLPSGNSANVEPEPTVDGVLQVPADIRNVGWWDGSAYAGDPFGSTVIAGHVDSRLQGLGFFAELLLMQVGDLITLRSETRTLTYRVVSTARVNKEALASQSEALDQRGPHRLVLITCSGRWHPEVRSYDSNLVILAEPVSS